MRYVVHNYLPALDKGAGSFYARDVDNETALAWQLALRLDKFKYARGLQTIIFVEDYDKWNAAYIAYQDKIELQRKFLKKSFEDKVHTFLHEIGHRGQEVDPETYKQYKSLGLNTVANFLAMANEVHREHYRKTGSDQIDDEVFGESYSRFCLGLRMPPALKKFWQERSSTVKDAQVNDVQKYHWLAKWNPGAGFRACGKQSMRSSGSNSPVLPGKEFVKLPKEERCEHCNRLVNEYIARKRKERGE